PDLSEYVILRDELKQTRALAQANENSRKLAVDRVRVLCEHVMREAHIKINNCEMPELCLSPKSRPREGENKVIKRHVNN
ncbi:MAG TPA: hypothetical protein VI451_08355, partial [Anaerolineales bacterium]|nr:hypothetical protein [Anaerolineales bacterium]